MKKLLLSFMTLTLAACQAGKDKTNIELVQDMMDQVSLKAQDWNQLTPPAGTVPVGYKPYPYAGDPLKAEQALVNPLAGQFSPEVLELGREKYEVYCLLCHGPKGEGDGQVAPKMLIKPPSLVSDKVAGFRDGRIFHIITDGQGVMGKYFYQIRDEKDRWALVNYVRNFRRR